MRGIQAFLRSRGARLAVMVVVLGGVLGLLAPVDEAQSAVCAFRPVIRTYYSDAAHTTTVGQRGYDCSCNDVAWGVTSAYVVNQTQCCPYFTC